MRQEAASKRRARSLAGHDMARKQSCSPRRKKQGAPIEVILLGSRATGVPRRGFTVWENGGSSFVHVGRRTIRHESRRVSVATNSGRPGECVSHSASVASHRAQERPQQRELNERPQQCLDSFPNHTPVWALGVATRTDRRFAGTIGTGPTRCKVDASCWSPRGGLVASGLKTALPCPRAQTREPWIRDSGHCLAAGRRSAGQPARR